MSSPYEICLLFPHGTARKAAVEAVDGMMRQFGAAITDESSLMLERTANSGALDEEIDDPLIDDPRAALEQLTSWPTGGGVAYFTDEVRIPVFFFVSSEGGPWTLVKLLLPASGFDNATQVVRDKYIELGRQLHERLQPTRTIMGWGLEAHGGWEREELDRLSRGIFEGQYRILDLRTEAAG
jgi:hypothetical protein